MRKPGRKPGFCMHLFRSRQRLCQRSNASCAIARRSLRGIAAPGRLVFRTRAAAICRV